VAVRSSPMNRKKKAPNVWAPENAAPKRSDGAEDVKDADITGVDVDFEAGRRWLAEGELDEGRRARYLTPQRADAEAFDTPVRPTGARAKADPTNGVTDVRIQSGFEASMVAQMQELISSNARAFEEIKRDVAELKLQQRNDHSVKAGPEADEEMLRRMCHGIVDNVAHRLSQSATVSRELVDNPVIDYVPDASNEIGVRDEVLRESDGSQEHGISGAMDLNDLNHYEHSDGDYVEDGQNVPFDEPPMRGVVFKEDRDDVTCKVSCRSLWEVVALATTRKDGCKKAQRCLNGRFKLRSGNDRIMYYHCTSHEDCKCCYRVSYCQKKASWVVVKRDYADHESGVLPNVIPKTKVCKLVPIDGEGEASDEGVRVERNIKDGPFRGIPSDIKEMIWKLHTSHALSGETLRMHLLAELGGDKERLPEARQITVRSCYTQKVL
jgi:hypothetical protein